MKAHLAKIPSGRVPAPRNTVPHLALAHMFTQLAQKHLGAAMANGPDAANARLPRPDMAAVDTRLGRPLMRRALIGSPDSELQQQYS